MNEIKKPKWAKRCRYITGPSTEPIDWNDPINIGTHAYAACEGDNSNYVYFTITDKKGKKFIAVIDTFSPSQIESPLTKLAVGDYIEIEDDEILGKTTIKTS